LRVLVAEDDEQTALYLVKGLAESGHVVDRAADGETALSMALDGVYEAIVLDRKLPVLDGLSVVRRLRRRDRRTPVLMLSGIATTTDRVDGLRAGCDDYLAKPYSFAELLARLEGLGRRADRSRGERMLRIGDLELDTSSRSVSRGGKAIALQRREFLLLEQLVRRAGQVVTRAQLLEAAWNYDAEPHDNIVEMHIHRLRRKIDEGFTSRLIETVPGAGYTIRTPEDRAR
jgi:two-component system, OmpR family, response regulator